MSAKCWKEWIPWDAGGGIVPSFIFNTGPGVGLQSAKQARHDQEFY
jgi:hypothetical protein